MVDISVIILNYNTFQLTCSCIASVYQQTYGVSFEIIVVDNGSTECDPKLIQEAFPDIILVKSKINLGFAKGNNLGIKHSSGKAILLLNSDTELLNNGIYLAFQRLMVSVDIGALTGKIVTPTGEVQHVAQRFPSIRLVLLQILRLFYFMSKAKRGDVFLGEYFHYEKETFPDWIWATFFLIRRETIALFPEGKLPEEFFMYEEDKLWGYYLRKKGMKLLFSPLPLVLHHVSGSSKHKKDLISQNKHILKNEFRVITMTKGKWYARLYFLLKALQYRTSKYALAPQLSKLYWSIAKKSPQQELPYFANS